MIIIINVVFIFNFICTLLTGGITKHVYREMLLMYEFLKSTRFSPAMRIVAAVVAFSFLYEIIIVDILRYQSSQAFAQVNTQLNLVMPSDAFLPSTLKAIHIDPQSPFEISFVIDGADKNQVDETDVNKLVQYFLAAMTTPGKDMWVNLSPTESNRIIAAQFGQTSAGRELLGQDQMLKQLAASLTYPESETGKAFWSRVYQKAIAMYGTTAVPIDTFQRVWIMPEKAVVYEYNGTAFITESRLKVLLEDDYMALKNAQSGLLQKLSLKEAQKVNNFSSTVTREIILPEIEKEINEGKNFASLRQIYNAIILATWFKKKLKKHILAQVYVDGKKVKGIEDDSEETAEKIYQQYMKVLEKGVYNYVRGDYDAPSGSMISRQYFSGGFSIGNVEEWLDIRPISKTLISSGDFLALLGRKLFLAVVRLRPLGSNGALPLPVPYNVGPLSQILPSQALLAGSDPGSVFKASMREVHGDELFDFYVDKFKKVRAASASSPLLVFIKGPAAVIKNADILKKAGRIEKTAVYLVDAGRIYMIDTQGNIGFEVSSSAVLSEGSRLVLVASSVTDEKVSYRDAAKDKAKRSSQEQLAAQLVASSVVVAGGPDKKIGAAGGPNEDADIVKRNTGGVDMQVEASLQIKGQNPINEATVLFPDLLYQDLQGMDFKILEFAPIINPMLFMPDFVKDKAQNPSQLLSLKTP